MKKQILFILNFIFVLGLFQADAEEVNFTASVNKRLLTPQETLVLSLTVSGTQKVKPFDLPEIKGLNLVYGPRIASQTQIVNGVVNTKRIFEYGFSSSTEGAFTIPSFEMEIEGKTYRSNPIEIEVKAGASSADSSGADGAEENASSLGKRIFAELALDKKEAVVNEQVILSFRLYRNIAAESLRYDPPVTQGFLEEALGEQRVSRKIVDGVEYEVIEIQKALFPLKTGTLEIPAVRVQGNLLFQSTQKRSGSPFESFFDDPFADSFFGRRYERRPIEVTSNSVTLQVRSLPETGKPDPFSGAVGDFSLTIDVKPKEVAVGDPITVTMMVSGSGNLQSLQAPTLKGDLTKFKTYEPESKTNILSREERIRGEKTFEVVLVPKEIVAETPKIEFSFFNPELQEYETLQQGPFPLTVTPAENGLSLQPVAPLVSEKKSVELLSRDIFYIKNEPGHLRPVAPIFYRQPRFYALFFFPILAYLLLFFWHLKQEKWRLNPSQARFSQADKQARQLLKQAASAAEPKEAFALIEKALIEFLANKTDQPQGAINVNELDLLLNPYSFSVDQIKKIQTILNACEVGRFAGAAKGREGISDLIEKSKQWLEEAQRVFQ